MKIFTIKMNTTVPFICLLLTLLYTFTLTDGANVNVKEPSAIAPENLTGRSLHSQKESDLALAKDDSFQDVTDSANHHDYEHLQRLGSSGLSLNSFFQASREQLNRTLQNQKQQLLKRWNEMMNKLKAMIIEKIQSFLNFNDNLATYITELLQHISNGSTAGINHIQEAIRKYLEVLVRNFGLKSVSSDD